MLLATLPHRHIVGAAGPALAHKPPLEALEAILLSLASLLSVVIAVLQSACRSSLMHRMEHSFFIISTFALYAVTIGLMLSAMQRGRTLWAIFGLCQLIVPGSIFISQCWLQVPFSNWRERAITYQEACGAIIGLNAFISFLNVIGAWENWGRARVTNLKREIYILSPLGRVVIWTIGVASVLAMLVVMRGSRDAFLAESGVGDKFIVRFAFATCTFIFALSMRCSGYSLKLLSVLLVAAGLVLAVLGFRYFLFNLLLTWAITTLMLQPPSLKTLGMLGLAAPLAYCLLMVGAYTRQSGMPAFQALFAVLSGDVPFESVMEYAGGNEQCTFYTWYFVEDRFYYSFGEYYLISMLRTLPQGVYLAMSDDLRLSFSHFLKEQCAPKWFLDADLTLGGYFFSEAHCNFWRPGPYIMLLVSYWAIQGIEALRRLLHVGDLIYIFSACSMYIFVLYGFENFLKPFWLTCAFAAGATWLITSAGRPPVLEKLSQDDLASHF